MSDDFGLWDVIVSMFWFMFLFAWIWMLITILGDIFRSGDLSGVAKTGWLVVVLFVPFLGVFAYVIGRGDVMNRRSIEAQKARDPRAPSDIREATGRTDAAEGGTDDGCRGPKSAASARLTPTRWCPGASR